VSKRFVIALLFVFGLLLLGPPSARAADFTQQVVDLTNAERAKQGLPLLAVSARLTTAAQAYAVLMATKGFFSHTGPDGSSLITRDVAAGYSGWTYLEENIASGQTSPAEVVAAWMNSPDHRANLLSTRVREIGVGYYFLGGSPYGSYWVEEFGSRSSTPSTTVARPAAPARPPASQSWVAPTGHTVNGNWLDFFRSHGDVDVLGLPRSDVIQDTLTGQLVQFFQRAVLEWHPENPLDSRIQRRLLGDALYPGVDVPAVARAQSSGPSEYFPFSPILLTGLGHGVSNYSPNGDPIYFKDFFDSHGGVSTFGYPKEEPKLRDGQWSQQFQAAVFQYHPEFDVDGYVPGTVTPLRNYRVELELLGDEYIDANGLPYH
jgi:hypothetical protein